MGVGYRCAYTMMVGDEREIKECLANWASARVGFSFDVQIGRSDCSVYNE
jgi:hypothetical protein